MVPDEFHFAPIFYDSVFHGVGELEEASVLICLLSDEDLLVVLLSYDLLVLGVANTSVSKSY